MNAKFLRFAAGILLAVLLWNLNQGPEWEVVASQGNGVIWVDGEKIAAGNLYSLKNRIRPGVGITVGPGANLDLQLENTVLFQLTPGTEITLPDTPFRYLGRGMKGEVRNGELRITTGPDFAGVNLSLQTNEVDIQVTGTTLAVICESFGSCVCVFEGEVFMGPRGEEMEKVPAQKRKTIFNDGRPPLLEDIRGMERMKLEMLRDQGREKLKKKE